MKKRWMWVLLCGIYGILLAVLIVLQWAAMQGDILRLLANLLALLLASPVVLLLVFLGRAAPKERRRIARKNADANMGEENDDLSGSSKHVEKNDEDRAKERDIFQIEYGIQTKEAVSRAEYKIRTMEEFCEWAEQWNFSAREQEVGWLIYKGYTNRQIALELYIAETTVKKHAGHIYEKAGVTGRKEFRAKSMENFSDTK